MLAQAGTCTILTSFVTTPPGCSCPETGNRYRRTDRYLWSGPSSPRLYGQRLNRHSGVRPVSLANRGNRQITERGRPYPGNRWSLAVLTKNGSPQGGKECPMQEDSIPPNGGVAFLPRSKDRGLLLRIGGIM